MERSSNNSLLGILGEACTEACTEAWETIRKDIAHQDDVHAAADEERYIGIKNATAALYEAGVDKERIISLLQKHWNLRPSQAVQFVRRNR